MFDNFILDLICDDDMQVDSLSRHNINQKMTIKGSTSAK